MKKALLVSMVLFLSTAVYAESRSSKSFYTPPVLQEKSTLVFTGIVTRIETVERYKTIFPVEATIKKVIKGTLEAKSLSFVHKHPGKSIIIEKEFNIPEVGQTGTFYINDKSGSPVLIGYIKTPKKVYETIHTKEIFSKLITRDKNDRLHSGLIKSAEGLTEFEKAYGVDMGNPKVDFKLEMLLFGITDNYHTWAYRFVSQKSFPFHILDYKESGREMKMKPVAEGKKYSRLQVFFLKRIDNVSHIRVRNIVPGLSRVYGK